MLVYICTYARGYIHTQHTRSTHNEARHTRHITYVHTQASQHALANTQTKHTHRKRAQLHGFLLVPWHLTSSTPKRLHAEADQTAVAERDPTHKATNNLTNTKSSQGISQRNRWTKTYTETTPPCPAASHHADLSSTGIVQWPIRAGSGCGLTG